MAKTRHWYKGGRSSGTLKIDDNRILHRLDGPAVEGSNGDRLWFKDGEFHREDGPAIIYANGDKHWYIDGKLHREGGAASEYTDGARYYYMHYELHRIDGPAIIEVDEPGIDRSAFQQWWVNGVQIDCQTNEEFLRIVKLLAFL